MFQEIEGQRPVIVSRNHNARIRTPIYRWTTPPDWSPAWNYQRSLYAGFTFGVTSALYMQIYEPVRDMLMIYAAPDNFSQLKTFTREVMKMENFKNGFFSKFMFYSAYGLSFEGARWYLWKSFAGGYPHDEHCVDITWAKKLLTSFAVGGLTSWIPVPFHNVAIRFQQDQILPKEFSRGYSNHLSCAYNIIAKDGPFPLMRSAGPIMGEAWAGTFALFFWIDFIKDKLRVIKNYGTDHPGFYDSWCRILYTSFAVYMSLGHAYPFRIMRLWVDELPKNKRGELYFKNYAEAFWKALGDNFTFSQLFNGFHLHLIRAGPPLFAAVWFADVIGLNEQVEFPAVYVPDEEE